MPVAAMDPGKFQHQGFGTLLMEEAERIAREEHGGYRWRVLRVGLTITFREQQDGSDIWCGHQGLLQEAGLQAGWALHVQESPH